MTYADSIMGFYEGPNAFQQGTTRRVLPFLFLTFLDLYMSRALVQLFSLSASGSWSPSRQAPSTTNLTGAFPSSPPALEFSLLSDHHRLRSSATSFSSLSLSLFPCFRLRPLVSPRSTRVCRGRLDAGRTPAGQGRCERSGRWSVFHFALSLSSRLVGWILSPERLRVKGKTGVTG